MRITLLIILLLAANAPSWANSVSSENLQKLRQYGEYLPRLVSGDQPINLQIGDTPPEASERLLSLQDYANKLRMLHLEQVARADRLEAQSQRRSWLDGIAQDYAGRGAYFDTELQLLWTRCAFGQEWSLEGDCSGVAQTLPLAQAQLAATEYQFNGYDDWRLPSVDELQSIVSCVYSESLSAADSEQCRNNSSILAVDAKLFPNSPEGIYWSYSQSPRRSYFNQAVDSSSGQIHHVDHAYSYYLRLVRSTNY